MPLCPCTSMPYNAPVELKDIGEFGLIDRLHRVAGTQRLVEVHGSVDTSSCTSCGSSWQLADVEALFDEDGIASCTGCGGKVKPDVVLFGELLPAEAIVRRDG
jgi:NAD-dependent deacetylase